MSSQRTLPPQACWTRPHCRTVYRVYGWSFLVRILPYMEYGPLYASLPVKTNPDLIAQRAH